jgi:hypothetical protein
MLTTHLGLPTWNGSSPCARFSVHGSSTLGLSLIPPRNLTIFVYHHPPTSPDPNASVDPEEASKPKQAQDAGTEYTKQLQHLIVEAVS